jgi:basic amino acid/polyamine antiporter, APA family
LGTDTQNAELRKDLSAFDAIAIVVGTIIGSAIFLIPSTIADLLRFPVLVLPIWIAGGVLTLFGALSLAELGAMFPGAGGLYTDVNLIWSVLTEFRVTPFCRSSFWLQRSGLQLPQSRSTL